ncbi:hypothetical protein QTI66_16185 [Variovorax sp. J22R133]|uniref:hypothetical protein n=1 Tax=Variovorax brevis TaxID=3053503 RepID=UPI002578D2B0|nr:hypothetical protein [Variovorax sp. J22R133]MDM0113699.1 hypothetical protein [Variovorax sp. J22R133]
MHSATFNRIGKLLAFAAVVEIVTGLAVLVVPALVIRLLLGVEAAGVALAMGRVFGIALIALGLACWPMRWKPQTAGASWRAMLAYNAMIALYLAWLGLGVHVGGLLLWPAVALHAAVALLLVLAARADN